MNGGPKPLSVSFDRVSDDLLRTTRFSFEQGGRGQKRYRKAIQRSAILIGLGVLLLLAGSGPGDAFWLGVGATVTFLSAAMLVALVLANRRQPTTVQKRFDANAMLRGPRTITISPDGIEIASPMIRQFFMWAATQDLVETDTDLYVPTDAEFDIHIPGRAFSDPYAMHEYAQTAAAFRSGQST